MKTQAARRALVALAALAGFAAAPSYSSGQEPPAEAAKKAEPVVVPFKMLASNHMVLDVKINGKGPYTLIFDVGSPVTLLSNRAAVDSGLVKEQKGAFPMLFSARGEAKIDDLMVGDLEAEGVPVLVMDHPVVGALGQILGRKLDGLVGHTFFARYKTTIDYQAETMAFEPVENEIRDVFTEMPDRLLGPKKARRVVLEPAALLGFRVDPAVAEGVEGATVAEVIAGSPAAEAGLAAGDLITSLDGRWTPTPADVYRAASHIEPGQSIEIVVLREGREETLALTPRAGF